MKVVINKCYGGFSVSREAAEFMDLEPGDEARDIERNDPKLIKCIEKLGEEANGRFAKLRIVKIPNGIEYTIEQYDGFEHISEKHRTWG